MSRSLEPWNADPRIGSLWSPPRVRWQYLTWQVGPTTGLARSGRVWDWPWMRTRNGVKAALTLPDPGAIWHARAVRDAVR